MTEDNPTTPPATPIEAAARERRYRLVWVGLILTLLASQIVLMAAMVYLATSDASFAIEPNYYQKGLNWDAVAAQRQQNQRLGWSAQLEVGTEVSAAGERTLICTLADRTGRPLDGAMIDAVAFAHARASDRATVTLVPAGNGRYEAPVRFARAGLWEFRLAVQRGPETFTYVEQRDVYPPSPGL